MIAAVAALAGFGAGTASLTAWPFLAIGSSSQLGRETLGKIGNKLVAHRRTLGGGIVFYDQPKPYGSWLCRVNRYSVPEKTLTGLNVLPQDHWDDDLEMTREYGVWRKPSLGQGNDTDRDVACLAYRDFDHLFRAADSADPERAAFLLDRILTEFGSGKPTIPVTCRYVSGAGESKCDGREVLRSLKLGDLGKIESVSEREVPNGAVHVDLLSVSYPIKDKLTFTQLSVTSEQHYGTQSSAEGELKSVEVVINEEC